MHSTGEVRILNTELNPWGRFLILANGGDVWFMLVVKFIGTVVACGVLLLIRQWSMQLGLVIASAVAGLQLCLLLFLFFA